jgi:hypothetical protein
MIVERESFGAMCGESRRGWTEGHSLPRCGAARRGAQRRRVAEAKGPIGSALPLLLVKTGPPVTLIHP